MGIDFAFANTLEVINGKLTGRTIGPIVNRERKRDLLESLAQTMDIELEQVRMRRRSKQQQQQQQQLEALSRLA